MFRASFEIGIKKAKIAVPQRAEPSSPYDEPWLGKPLYVVGTGWLAVAPYDS